MAQRPQAAGRCDRAGKHLKQRNGKVARQIAPRHAGTPINPGNLPAERQLPLHESKINARRGAERDPCPTARVDVKDLVGKVARIVLELDLDEPAVLE